MELLPLGSIIVVNYHKLCIIGYATVENESSHIGYVVVSYPLGFTNIKKAFFVPRDHKYEVLAEGYKTKASEAALNTIGKSLEWAKQVPIESLFEVSKMYQQHLASKKEAAED